MVTISWSTILRAKHTLPKVNTLQILRGVHTTICQSVERTPSQWTEEQLKIIIIESTNRKGIIVDYLLRPLAFDTKDIFPMT